MWPPSNSSRASLEYSAQRLDQPRLRGDLLGERSRSRRARCRRRRTRSGSRAGRPASAAFCAGLGLRDLAGDRPAGEDRPDDRAAVAPHPRRAAEQVVEVGARGAERAGQRDRREVLRLRRADLRVGGDQLLLGLQQVRAALEQLRGHAGGHARQRERVDAACRAGSARDCGRAGSRARSRSARSAVWMAGICAAAVSYCERACSTFISRDLAVLELELHQPQRLAVGVERALARSRAARRGRAAAGRSIATEATSDRITPRRASSVASRFACAAFGLPADAAPQVDLPARAGEHLVGVGRVGTPRQRRAPCSDELAVALARAVGLVADLREERRARGREHAGGLLDVGDGDLHVPVVRERLDDQPSSTGSPNCFHHSMSARLGRPPSARSGTPPGVDTSGRW